MSKTNYNESGGQQKASLTIGLEVLAYYLKADRKNDFQRFYNRNIRHWLADNNVAHANAWIVGDYLIVVSSQPMPPWNTISGLEEFVKNLQPVSLQELDQFSLSTKEAAASYTAA